MARNKTILDLLAKQDEIIRNRKRNGLIIQPGAIGDCLLTLPLAFHMKKALKLEAVDMVGHMDYISYLPGRSCINSVRSIDALELNRLFLDSKDFDIPDGDSIIFFLSNYSYIVSFLGEPDSHFEKNLIFTTHCGTSSEIVTLPLRPVEGYKEHLSKFYIDCLKKDLKIKKKMPSDGFGNLLKAMKADSQTAKDILAETDIGEKQKLAFIHPGSGGKGKCWHIENYFAIAESLRANGYGVFFIIGPAEMERLSPETIGAISKFFYVLNNLPLSQILAVLSLADVYIGNDTGITHMAGQLGVRTIAVFGPTDPAVYSPLGSDVTIFRDDSPDFAQKANDSIQAKILSAVL